MAISKIELRSVAIAYAVDFNKTRSFYDSTKDLIEAAKLIEEYILSDASECLQDAPGCTGDSATCVCGGK